MHLFPFSLKKQDISSIKNGLNSIDVINPSWLQAQHPFFWT